MVNVRFDLSAVHALPPVRARRVGHWIGLAVAIVSLFTIGYSVLGRYIEHRGFGGWSVTSAVALVIPTFFVVAGAFIYAQAGPGDDFLCLDDKGITFVYSNKRERTFEWSNPHFSLTLERKDGLTAAGAGGTALCLARDRFPSPSMHYLTEEAYNGILGEANLRGLAISNEASSYPGWTKTRLTRSS